MGKVANALRKAAAEGGTATEGVKERALDSSREEHREPEKVQAGAEGTGRGERGERVERQGSGRWDERLLLSAATTGMVAESIRTLRTRILYPIMGTPPRTLLVTSASPGEGKSFICANLGISLAQGVDNYCVIVDSDLRRPSQHALFGLQNRQGIVDHLQQGVPVGELILKSGLDKLSILPAGPPPVNPAELSGSGSMISLVDELRSRYEDRFVLVDSPPLHAAAETAVLAQHVDGVVLVVRHGISRREHVRQLVETIGREKILGVVFNAYTTSALDSKVFGYYDYQHDYYRS
ncbi:polysaccharide biosynthesis tyrosine autokinase [Desulfogranum mediterraneum]|uniref:polysaccharide biosynthesis tyrosine autokinase n=1 Tax=Desulfogranum mediterraneum TaxID=160661 RepID=UPI00040CEA85|nr:polysaccharide biosynthesis tyrosine autokinase [Desulfogranum mediterraneum]